MTKKTALTNVEKYKIQQLLMQDTKVAEIAKQLDRTPDEVENYIDGELSDLLNTIGQVEREQEDDENETIINRVANRLVMNGVTKRDASKLIRKGLEMIQKAGEEVEENRLYSRCIGQMRTGEFIVKKTVGGNEGVGIMTGTASQRSDMSKNRRKKVAKKISGTIYQPSTGKFLT